MNHHFRFLTCIMIFAFMAESQTLVDLRRQTRNIDFQDATFTRPVRTGTTLPIQCSVGEMFFKIGVPAGSNLYGCVEGPAWVLLGGAAAGAAGGDEDSFSLSQTSGTVLSLGANCSLSKPCKARFGNTAYLIANPASVTATSGTGTAYFYVAANGTLVVGHSGLGLSCSSGCTVAPGVSSFPDNSIPLHAWTMLAGSWTQNGGVDFRAKLSQKLVTAGTGLQSVENNGTTTLSLNMTQVLTQNGNNNLTGINTFSSGKLVLPNSASLPAQCAVGEVFHLSSGVSGSTLYGCHAANTWTRLSGIQPTSLAVSRTHATALSVGNGCNSTEPCLARFGSTVTSFTSTPTVTISAGTGHAFFYIAEDGTLTAGHDGLTLVCSVGCSVVAGITAFPLKSLPLYKWSATTGSWDGTGGTDQRALLSQKNISSGVGLTTTENAGTTTLAVDPAVVGLRAVAPATATTSCTVGQWSTDTSFYYTCVASNSWKRVGLSTW